MWTWSRHCRISRKRRSNCSRPPPRSRPRNRMNENQTNPKAIGSNERTMFDHEKLDVYHLELKFIGWVTPLLEEVSQNAAGKTSEVRDQLDRASLSALLNTAEGNGKRQRQVRAKFFDDARGSATECAACLDALIAKGAAREERVAEGKKCFCGLSRCYVDWLIGLILRRRCARNPAPANLTRRELRRK